MTDDVYCASCARLINRACNEKLVLFPHPVGTTVKYNGVDCEVLENNHMGAYKLLCEGKERMVSYIEILSYGNS
jgi:hypothetical protein